MRGREGLGMRVGIALLVCATLGACGGSAELGALTEACAPFLEDFGRFDRWARRAVAADAAFRSDEARDEAAFAPLRRAERVLGAWVERDDTHEVLSLRGAARPPDELAWVQLRVEPFGTVRVARGTIDQTGALYLSRASTSEGRTVTVTMAFSTDAQ